MKLNASYSFGVILQQAIQDKTTVYLFLTNGKEYCGKVIEVSESNVIISLEGSRSFFDVIIRLSSISSIEVKIRNA